ncbi:MAG: hypothetical protein ACKN85_14425 [Pirellula sp.]
MTQLTRHRRKKRRFYWVELGFLLLGLIGLRPEILTELLPNHQNHYVPVPSPQTFLQPIYQVPGQQTHGYSYPPATYLPANNYPPTQPRLASNPAFNPSEVTSRYSTNPGYAYGSTSSNNSTPPVVWPEGYQPSSYPSNGPNVYRR